MLAPIMAIRPLEPEDLVAHYTRPAADEPLPGAPQPYEWWYFEVHFPGPALDGKGEPIEGDGVDDWVLVVSCHLPHFVDPVRLMDVVLGGNSRGRGRQVRPAFDYAGLAISIYRCTPTEPLIHSLVGFSATRCVEAVASTSAPFSARWGSEVAPIVKIEERRGGRYVLTVRDRGWWAARGLVDKKFQGRRVRPLDLHFDLEFAERSPGFKVDDGVLVRDRWGGEHHWALQMPDARVTGRVSLRTAGRSVLEREIASIGYHDHQWGPHLPMDVMEAWSWGRVLVTPDARPADQDLMVFFRSVPLTEDADPGVAVEGADIFAYVPSGRLAVQLEPPEGRDAVTPRGWDTVNYPLVAHDSADHVWSEGRLLPDVAKSLLEGKRDDEDRPGVGPPVFVPADDTEFSLLGWLAMLIARPLARTRLAKEIGYWGAISCQGAGPTGGDGTPQEHRLLVLQRGTSVEPWPFYNRYVPRAAAWRGSGAPRHDRVRFALSEYLEIRELLQRPPFTYSGKPIHTDLLGMAVFSEMMTTIEPGAPTLRDLLGHFG